MRYFTYIAEQSFKTGPNGERLFYHSGPWSRPYLIPDAETERAIYRKQVWMLRIALGGLIVTQPFLFIRHPEVIGSSLNFIAYMAAITFGFWIVGRIVLAPELRRLERAPARLSWTSFMGQTADKHSFVGLALGFAACLAFVAIGIWLLAIGEASVPAIFSIVFFGACAVGWMYALSRKRTPAARS
jgi:hypothetical protein